MEANEGDVIKDPQGNRYKIVNGSPVPVLGVNPETGQAATSYQEIFAGNRPQTTGQKLAGGVQALSEGSLFGFGSEAGGLVGNLLGDPSIGQRMEGNRAQFQQENPWSNFGLEMGGMLMNPLTRSGAKMMAARPFTGGVMSGGLFGGLFGAGKAEEGERLQGAGIGAGIGGALGGPLSYGSQLAMQKLGPLLTEGVSKVRQLAQPTVRTAQERVDDFLRPFMQKSFDSADDAVQKAAELGPRGTLMDLSPEMQGVASSAYNKMVGGFRSKAAQLFADRSKGSIKRIESSLNKAFGRKGSDLTQFIKETMKNRAAETSQLYDDAYQQSVTFPQVGKFLGTLDEQIAKSENTPFASALTSLRKALFKTNPDGTKVAKTSVEELAFARDALADKASSAFKKGDMKLWRFLKDVRNQFDDVLMPDSYKQANQIFSSKSKILDAADMGEKFFNPSTKTSDLIEWLGDASLAERQAYITGMVQGAKNKMGSITEGGKVSRFFNTPNAREKLIAVIGDEKRAAKFIQDIERENLLKATENVVAGNSFTASRQEADKLFDSMLKTVNENPIGDKEGLISRFIIDPIVKALKLQTGMTKEFQKQLEKRLLTEGLTQENIRLLMQTPARDIVKQTMIDLSPQAAQLTVMGASNQAPSIGDVNAR